MSLVVRAHLCYCVCRAVAGAVLAVVGALSLSWLVAIVLCVAVVVAGGESVRKMFVLREKNVRRCCGRCASRCRPRCPRVLAAAACVVLTVVVGISVLFFFVIGVVVGGGASVAVTSNLGGTSLIFDGVTANFGRVTANLERRRG